MKFNWFWISFSTLVFFTGAIISWGLIYDPIGFDPEIISHFDSQVNGQPQHNQIWTNPGSLKELLPIIEKKWTGDGWNPVGGGIDLFPILSGLEPTDELQEHVQAKVFQKKDEYRILGLLQPSDDPGFTYGYTSEIPDMAFNPQNARKQWAFPIPPPDSAVELYCQKLGHLQVAYMTIHVQDNPKYVLEQICNKTGYECNLFSQKNGNEIFFVSKNRTRIVAVLNFGPNFGYITMTYLENKF